MQLKQAERVRNAKYDEDFYVWTQRMAEIVRAGHFEELDRENVAEELESLGRSDRREVRSRLTLLLMHLLNWQVQPELRSGSWSSTIRTQRRDLLQVLNDSPSLKAMLHDFAAEVYPTAVQNAIDETRLLGNPFPAECPFTDEQILHEGYLPEGPPQTRMR